MDDQLVRSLFDEELKYEGEVDERRIIFMQNFHADRIGSFSWSTALQEAYTFPTDGLGVHTIAIEMCTLAEQFPQDHLKLIQLFQILKDMAPADRMKHWGWKTREFFEFSDLPPRDTERRQSWENFNIFMAKLQKSGKDDGWNSYGFVVIRDALECGYVQPPLVQVNRNIPLHGEILNATVPPAAQWICHAGDSLHAYCKDTLESSVESRKEDSRMVECGELYKGSRDVDLNRWRFWKRRFGDISGYEDLAEHTRRIAQKACEKMGEIDGTLSQSQESTRKGKEP